MHETGCRPTSSYGSLQAGQHELCAHMLGDHPSNDAAVEVDDNGQVQSAYRLPVRRLTMHMLQSVTPVQLARCAERDGSCWAWPGAELLQ